MAQQPRFGGRIAVVGCGSRAAMFVRGVVARPSSQIVALCEPNAVRAQYYNDLLTELGAPTVEVYKPEQYEEMLKTERVEAVVVTCIDALHDQYIIPALNAGGALSICPEQHANAPCSTRPDRKANDDRR